jgi:hypothetical protein
VKRLFEHLEDTRSPYQLNMLAFFVWAVSVTTIMLGAVLLPVSLAALVIVPLFAGLIAAHALSIAGNCPECSKSPMQSQLVHGRLAWLLRAHRGWPERICSYCGYDLTRPPACAEPER